MSIYGKRLRRLGTCFSLLSLSEKLLSVQATKLRHNIFSGTNFLAIVANFCSETSSLLLRIYCLIFAANLLSKKHQFTFQPQYSSASSASMPPKYSLESNSLGSFVLTGIVLVWISNESPIFSTNILGVIYFLFISYSLRVSASPPALPRREGADSIMGGSRKF